MSVADTVVEAAVKDQERSSAKRKRQDGVEELEIDVNAAEPPSKKQLRKAKKSKQSKAATENEDEDDGGVALPKKHRNSQKSEDTDPLTSTSRSQYGIWIGNLSFTTTKEDLLNFITNDTDSPIDRTQVTRVHMPAGAVKFGKPQNKGFAYIDFTDKATLNRALDQSERLFSGRRVLIKDAKSFEGRPASKKEIESGKPPSKRIFVGNLSFDTTAEALEEHFGVCGNIAKTHMATFEDSGKCKGYGWVEFEQLSAAQAAMRGWVEQGADGDSGRQSKRRIWLRHIDGRKVRMEFAEDATTRYNKRFGKEAKGSEQNGGAGGEEQTDAIVEVQEPSEGVPKAKSERKDKPKKSRREYGYEEDTVKRLTGGITESQGTKVTFD